VAMIGPDGPLQESTPPAVSGLGHDEDLPEFKPATVGANSAKPRRVPAHVHYRLANHIWDFIVESMTEAARFPQLFTALCDEPIETV
jgi:hypothetical protein